MDPEKDAALAPETTKPTLAELELSSHPALGAKLDDLEERLSEVEAELTRRATYVK